MLDAYFLLGVRKKALKGKVWFKVLDSLERGIVNLSAKVLDSAQTISCLGIVLSKIIAKIEDALKSPFELRLECFGLSRSRELTDQSLKLGNTAASDWGSNIIYAKYITFMSFNMPLGRSI
jgi:hypothetical protein